MRDSGLYLGIDVGGTSTRVALVSAEGTVLRTHRDATAPSERGRKLLDGIAAAARELCKPYQRVVSAGLAVPGALDAKRGVLLRAVNLRFLEGVCVRDELATRLGSPVCLETDVAAAAWGEYATARPAPKRLVYLSVGTGIGAAAILNGRVCRHTNGGAGHLGQMIVEASPHAARGPCGTAGTLEAFAAGPAIERQAADMGLPSDLSELERICASGDSAADHLVDRVAVYLAAGVINAAYLYSPDTIMVGGGVSLALPSVVDRAWSWVPRLGGALLPPDLSLRTSRLGDDAGVVGAALLARSNTSGTMHPCEAEGNTAGE